MPFVKIYLRKGKSDDYLRLVSEAIHEALVSEASVPPDDKFHVIHQLDAGEMFANPSYGGVTRSGDLVVIEITLNLGRSLEVKKEVYRRITRNLQRAVDLRSDDVIVSMVEVAKENWSFGKGLATYA
jgi:phenylpyruvate tautomerase PptA (4-oxalocrotonate tautomerase family)